MLNQSNCTVAALNITVKDVFKSIYRIEKSVEESVSGQKGEKFAVSSVLVGKVDRWVENKTELSEVVNESFESSHNKSLVHDLSESIAEGSWFWETSFHAGISLIGSHESVKSYMKNNVRLRTSLTMLSWRNPQKQGYLTAPRVSSYLDVIKIT